MRQIHSRLQITSIYITIHLQAITSTDLNKVDADLTFTYTIIRKIDFNAGGFGYTILQNPVFNHLRLSLQLSSLEKTVIEIRDASGRLFNREEKLFSTRQVVHSITVNHLPKGTYYVTVKNSSEMLTKVFIIN